MGRNTAVKLKVTPLQFESRFVDQAEMSHVPVKLYIQKKEFNGKVVGGHTLNALITNPAFTPPAKEGQQEGEGKRKHLLGKKSRDFLKGVAIGSQGAAIGASVIPGAQPLAPAFEAASLASGALAGMGKPAKKKRYTLKAKKNSKSLLN